MFEEEFKYVDKSWDGSKSRWTPEDLLQCIPASMARYARSVTAKGETPSKSNMHLPYKEPKTHDININGISAALSRVDQVSGPSAADKSSARSELERARTRARKALGKDKKMSLQDRYIDREWNPSKARFTIEQLKAAMPAAMLRHAANKAARDGREINRDDCTLLYKELDGSINLNGIEYALAHLNEVVGLSLSERALIRGELEGHRRAGDGIANYQTGISQTKISELQKLGFEALQFNETYSEPEPVETPQAPQQDLAYPLDGFRVQTLETPAFGYQQSFDPAVGGLHREHASVGNPDNGSVQMSNIDIEQAPPFLRQMFANTSATPKKMNLEGGVIENDYRPLPNFRALGITRKAGPAIESEMKAFTGQTKLNGEPVGPEDFFSSGAVLANIDIIPHLMAFIPPVELGRIGTILQTRSKKSDQNHSREVLSGNFTVIDPAIGTDPDAKMHMDHPLLGKVPYTALTARLLFPLQEKDPAQMAAVEAAQRGRLQNLSIAFGFGHVACGLCGEMRIQEVLRDRGYVTGFSIDPAANPDMFQSHDDEYFYSDMNAILRMPVDTEGGFVYRSMRILNAEDNGLVQVDPVAEASLPVDNNSVFMIGMSRMYYYGGYAYCRLHGFQGSYSSDGRRTVGMFVNMRALLNVAAVDAGAINDARLVLDPDITY